MTVKLLTEHNLEFLSLKGGCTGSSESILVKMPQCWKSHVKLIYRELTTVIRMMHQVSLIFQTRFQHTRTVVPAKSDSDIMFCLQSYQAFRIDRSLLY